MTTAASSGSVLTFGEGLVGYATTQDTLSTAGFFTRFPGGADLNVAVGLSRLGVPATWATVLGHDPHGDYLVDLVSRLGIRTVIRRASGPTALMFKGTVYSDVKARVCGACGFIELFAVDPAGLLEGARERAQHE
jgi:hypothetical protein